MISQAELDAMRDAVEADALPDTAQVKRFASTGDGIGGRTKTPTTVASALPCRLSLPTGGNPGLTMMGQTIAERLGNRVLMIATFAANSDVQDNDQIVVGGRTYEVLMIINGSWEIARRAMVAEVV